MKIDLSVCSRTRKNEAILIDVVPAALALPRGVDLPRTEGTSAVEADDQVVGVPHALEGLPHGRHRAHEPQEFRVSDTVTKQENREASEVRDHA